MTRPEAVERVLLGTAVGDSLGLPAEGLSRQRIQKLGWSNRWRHRLLFGRGMVSDDTEHSVLVAESILESNESAELFEKAFARRLRGWFASAPPGIGFATLRACLKLCLGFPRRRCGVFSAGNGPAMRSGVIGAAYPSREDSELRRALVEKSTRLTHTDPLAFSGAWVVTEIVASGARNEALNYKSAVDLLLRCAPEAAGPWQEYLEHFLKALSDGDSVADFATRIGMENGLTGFVLPSVFVPVYAMLQHQHHFADGLTCVLNCGGDTDTCGAIFGAMAAAHCDIESIPQEWIDGIRDFPLSVSRLRTLARRFEDNSASGDSFTSIYSPWIVRLIRNLGLGVLAIGHVAARHLPGGTLLLRRLA